MKSKLYLAGCYSVVATCFSIPVSTSMMGVFALLTVVFWMASGRFLTFIPLLRSNMVAALSLLLFLLFLGGTVYTSASQEEALYFLKKYRELLFLPIVISVIAGNQKMQQYAVHGFFAGCFVLLLASFAMWLGVLEPRHGIDGNANYSLLFHITHSIFMAFFAFWVGHRVLDQSLAAPPKDISDKQGTNRIEEAAGVASQSSGLVRLWGMKTLWLVLLASIVFNLFFVCAGRTGMCLFLVLILLLLWQRVSWVVVAAGVTFLALLLPAMYYLSPNFAHRVNYAKSDITSYEKGDVRTSLGQRVYWSVNSFELVKQKPFFGHGTGSFSHEHYKLSKYVDIYGEIPNDPHNEYALIAVQLGLVGLVVWLSLLASQWRMSFRLPEKHKWVAQGLLVTIVVGCTMNSLLHGSADGHLYAFFSGVLFSTLPASV